MRNKCRTLIEKIKLQCSSERGDIGDSVMVVVAIGISAVLMLIFPVMTMADRTDDVAQQTAQTATTEFVDDVRTTGKLTMDKYSQFVENISATGNTYDIEMELQVLDENPGKKTTQAETTKIGENVYYTMYTSQILDEINPSSGVVKVLLLKEGDIFSTSIKNSNTTMSQQLKNFFYKVTGNDLYIIGAEHGGIVTANGSGN